MLERFLSAIDLARAERTFENLSHHNIRSWVLTGGLATEIHHELRGFPPSARALNDLDSIVESFDCVPESLQQDFLFRHIHPFDPPNKTIVQAVDRDGALRIDIFRSCGEVITRSANVNLWGLGAAYLIGGLVARSARLSLEVTRGVPTPRKHSADFLRLAKLLVHERLIETAWQTHRRPVDPATFRLANTAAPSLHPRKPGTADHAGLLNRPGCDLRPLPGDLGFSLDTA